MMMTWGGGYYWVPGFCSADVTGQAARLSGEQPKKSRAPFWLRWGAS